MTEAIQHFHGAAQDFSEAKQIVDAAVAEGRGMTAEELARYNTLFNAGADKRALMETEKAKEMANRIATIEGELAASINDDGGPSLSEQARRGTRMFHDQYGADSVPYRWTHPGPPGSRAVQLESAVPNPALVDDWSWMSRRSGQEYRKAVELYLATHEQRAQQIDLDELGGYYAMPVQMINDILKVADNMVYVRQFARVEPRVDAKALAARFLEEDVEDADWTGELTNIAETTAKWGTRMLRPRNLNKMFRESYDTMMQTPSLSAYLVERLGYKRGIAEERGYLTGNGVNEPLGVFTASDQGISTGRDVSNGNSATAPTLVGVQSAKWSIRTGYWDDLRWLGPRDYWREVSLLRNADGTPLWHMSLNMAHPDRLLGDPAYISEYAPSVFTTGKYVAVLGNWMKGYLIGDAYDMTIQRVDQRWAEINLIGYIMRSKSDGMPVDEQAFARVQLG